jgi:hypothetical protein
LDSATNYATGQGFNFGKVFKNTASKVVKNKGVQNFVNKAGAKALNAVLDAGVNYASGGSIGDAGYGLGGSRQALGFQQGMSVAERMQYVRSHKTGG